MEKYITIGVITRTHGVRGEVKVFPLTDDINRFKKLKSVYVETPTTMDEYTVENVKFFKNIVILKFTEINDMDSARAIKGLYLSVDRKDANKLPEGAYFICDLIGCKVYDDEDNYLGVLNEVLKTGSNDVYVVKSDLTKTKEILIPALKDVIKQVSIEDQNIVVRLPKGLMDL